MLEDLVGGGLIALGAPLLQRARYGAREVNRVIK